MPVDSVQGKTVVTAALHSSAKSWLWKKEILDAAVVAVAIFIITRFTSTVDEACDWCGNRPSVAYKMGDASYSLFVRIVVKNMPVVDKLVSKYTG